MVGSRCVVQGCSSHRNKTAGMALHASPTDRTRDLFAPCTLRKIVFFELSIRHSVVNLNPVLCLALGRKEPSTERESTRQRRMKEKERQKLRVLWVLLMLNICAFMNKMFDILISPI